MTGRKQRSDASKAVVSDRSVAPHGLATGSNGFDGRAEASSAKDDGGGRGASEIGPTTVIGGEDGGEQERLASGEDRISWRLVLPAFIAIIVLGAALGMLARSMVDALRLVSRLLVGAAVVLILVAVVQLIRNRSRSRRAIAGAGAVGASASVALPSVGQAASAPEIRPVAAESGAARSSVGLATTGGLPASTTAVPVGGARNGAAPSAATMDSGPSVARTEILDAIAPYAEVVGRPVYHDEIPEGAHVAVDEHTASTHTAATAVVPPPPPARSSVPPPPPPPAAPPPPPAPVAAAPAPVAPVPVAPVVMPPAPPRQPIAPAAPAPAAPVAPAAAAPAPAAAVPPVAAPAISGPIAPAPPAPSIAVAATPSAPNVVHPVAPVTTPQPAAPAASVPPAPAATPIPVAAEPVVAATVSVPSAAGEALVPSSTVPGWSRSSSIPATRPTAVPERSGAELATRSAVGSVAPVIVYRYRKWVLGQMVPGAPFEAVAVDRSPDEWLLLSTCGVATLMAWTHEDHHFTYPVETWADEILPAHGVRIRDRDLAIDLLLAAALHAGGIDSVPTERLRRYQASDLVTAMASIHVGLLRLYCGLGRIGPERVLADQYGIGPGDIPLH